MTPEEYDKLSDQEKRVKVAELCGYVLDPEYADCVDPIWDNGMDRCHADQLPDYLNDLNACHEFEKTLTGDDRLVYIDYLTPMSDNDFERRTGCFASAEQRCKAFVLTMTGGAE